MNLKPWLNVGALLLIPAWLWWRSGRVGNGLHSELSRGPFSERHLPKRHRDGLPGIYDFRICIDTNVYGGGWLTCLNPESGEYWQANELSESRQGTIQR